ncbi:hypothetical protein O181_055911 [Austropuccinia psidii MF-1]|uniref:Integrase catalytic domain-containing protein n=1 Tax=Austropuccinia psidii MF-1 TaxID=1389203 RepID=A0A9Q3E5D2_9BASI|nr:hypothetical protein [Austropuccinia psidii MF-1]
MDRDLLIWNRVISHTGIFKNIISHRDPKFKLALWTNSHNLLGKKLSFSTASHPQTDGLAEIIIQTLEDTNRRLSASILGLKYSDGFTHYWCTLIPAFTLAQKMSIHASAGKTPAILEKGWNPKLPVDTLKKYFFDINHTASRFELIPDKVSHHSNESINDAFKMLNKSGLKVIKPQNLN